MQETSYEDCVGQRHSAGEYEAVSCKNICIVCEIGLFTEDGEIGGLAILCIYVIVAVYFAYFESFIVYRNTRRPRYVSKRLINAALRSCERFHNVRA